ncbi:Peptidase S24-like [Rikenella microfusus]|uniref:Peptidase S24-like n=1 Tax=Rikenella microfusus TaxID=28139 RepID=A0A379MS98_9BACT|nr:Peptidase S24-like [Rikenella microfusus]
MVKENDHINDHIFDHKRKLPKTWSIEHTETTPISTQILTDSEVRRTKVSPHSPKPAGALYDLSPDAPSMLSDVDTSYLAGGGYVEVPVVDIEAAAGGGASNCDYMDESDNLRFPVSLLRPTKSKRLCINVAGESMEPTLFDGTQIVVRLLDRSEWGGIRSGDVYVVTNRSGETFIKRVRNKLRLQGVLVLTSDNPDQRRYRPFELSEEEIFNVWAVELMISDNIPPSDREIDDLRDQIGDLRMLIERLAAREN